MNSFAPINDNLIDVVLTQPSGYPIEFEREDTTAAVRNACGAAARDFPQSMWIEPKDWPERSLENDKNHTWGMNYVSHYTMQDPTHECTTHSAQANASAARNRQRGPKKDFRYPQSADSGEVFLSPLSIYAEANPRQWGGANVRQVMEIACKRGFLPDKIQPRDYGFKHTLQGTTGRGNNNQSHGDWVALRNFPDGWQDTAKWFMPQEVIFPGSWEEAVCLVLHGLLVSVGRNGHAIPWAQWMPEKQLMAYPDSYNVTRYDSLRTVKSAWQGAFAIATMTTPDDWLKPAG
jgi:hypothetical protein